MRRVESRESRVESRKRIVAPRSVSGPGASTLASRLPRRGFTLVELLITITIIGILAGLILGVASLAGETARHRHTEQIIARLHTLLMEHYDTYKTRRVTLRERQLSVPGIEEMINNQIPPNASSHRGRVLAEARLYALREMMLMEVPDRWSDVLLTSVGPPNDAPPINANQALAPLYLAARTDLSNVYLRRYRSLVGRTNELTGRPNTADEIRRNQGAECLYMIITIATGDGEARALFGESTIGDSDGDGAPEFLDGWEHPINFIRWAPGFDSQIQVNANLFTGPNDSRWKEKADIDHDAFDIFRSEPRAFRLVPLIYSPGADEDSGLFSAPDFVTWRPTPASPAISVGSNQPFVTPRLTPYDKGIPNSPTSYFGTDFSLIDPSLDKTSTDNIHNHLLGDR